MSHEEIALGIGIDRKTLAKHFEWELSTGAHQRRLEVIEAMHRAATDGKNVAAQKAYLAMEPALAAPPLPAEVAEKPPEGKKAQRQADAVSAHVGSDWAGLLPTFPKH